MFPFKSLLSHAIIACALVVCPASADTYVETGGILIMEAESSQAQDGWSFEDGIGGYAGSGYLLWNGADSFALNTAGRGTITYRFRIQRAGNYELLWRSRITRGDNRTEHNDSWVRFPTGRDIPGEQALNGWTKVFMSTLGKWAWQSATVDGVGRRVRQYFSAGEHTLQISGRSNGHAIDRIALFDYSDNQISSARFDSMSQSGSTGNSENVNPPQNEPSPEPQPLAVQIPSSVEPPIVAVSGGTLFWSPVAATAINVHRGNGTWLASLPGTRTEWQAPEAGTYYLVSTGPGSWESWGRSDTVTVDPASMQAGGSTQSGSALSTRLSIQVYSATALELFWTSDESAGLSFEVRRDNQLLTISEGRSYFDDALQAGTHYTYRVTGINAAGDAVTSERLSATTLGGPVNPLPGMGGLGLTAQIYSQSAIELFWNKSSPTIDSTNRFEIYLGSERLATTNGRSFFIEGLAPDADYAFAVVALDSSSTPILSESVTLRTFGMDVR